MKSYWDSSALINALASRHVLEKLKQSGKHNNFARSHGLCEVFSTVTGRGLPVKSGGRVKLLPSDAAEMISGLAESVTIRDLSLDETLETLQSAESFGVQGPQVYDLLHVKSALLCGAEVIYTLDDDFSTIRQGIETRKP